jgi:hypothetical protein
LGKDKTAIILQKAEVTLVLPLTAIVGNAMHDYIELERPKIDCGCIFITRNRPFSWRVKVLTVDPQKP